MHISRSSERKRLEIDFITLEEMKQHLRVQHNEDDAIIFSQIYAATENAEKFLRMHIIKKEIEVTILGDIEREIPIDIYPINNIHSFKYYHNSVEFKIKEKEDFEFDDTTAKIFVKKIYISDVAKILLEVGFGDQVASSIKQGIMKHVEKIYNNRPLEEVFKEVVPFYQTHRRYGL
jgi:hypothetical protein